MIIHSPDALEGIRQKAIEALSVREASNNSSTTEAAGLEKGTPHMQIL